MKNNNLYIKCSFFLTALFLLNSCTEYLKEEPTSGFTAEFVYNTPEGLETGVVGLYNIQRSFWESGTNNGSDPIVIDAKDDLTVPRGGEISNYGKINSGRFPTNSGVHGTYWNLYYRILDRSNALIKAAASVDMPDARRNQIIAEAKFFRANSVFTLFKLFNNIYVTTEPTTPENALTIIKDKTPEADIYKLVKEDLTFAIANLQWNVTAGKVGQGAARHLKAEVALWQSDWLEAKTQSETVIAQVATHALNTGTDLVFKGDMNTKEALWVLQFKKAVNGNANKVNFNLMPNYAEQTPGSKYTIEQAGRGFGWLTMNNYVRDLLAQSPNDTRIKGTYYIKDYVYNDPATLPAGQTLGSIIRNNPSAPWKEFGDVASRNGFFIRQNAGCRKYFPDDGIPTEDTQVKNIMMARLAETYLYAAEANMRLGNNPAALINLNKVRTRANTPALTNVITIEDILDEQARELAFEGRRWYMLKRTGKLYAYIVNHAGYGKAGDLGLQNSGTHANTAADPFTFANDARRNMQTWMVNWVIPKSQMDLLGPGYPQNNGY
jgi:hypothetical protein